jgi:multidrug resistance efflux pump
VARVSGEVIQAGLEINQVVETGDVVIKIDPVTYELKLATAEANLERARQNLRAGTAGLITIEAGLREAKAQQRAAQSDLNRIEGIYRADPGATSESARDAVRTALETTNEKVQGLEADLLRAREQLAAEGDETPEIRSAISDIHQAKIKIKYTTIKAPGPGMVINMKVEEGMYAKEGSSLGTFVPFSHVWVEANFRENSLGNIKAGDPVEIVLDSAPGKVFDGKVVSIGYAVKAGTELMRGTLAAPKKQGGWLRDAQYFPVIIEFNDVEAAKPYRIVGGQADVIIYTGNNLFLNTLGRLWIRLASIFSYVY